MVVELDIKVRGVKSAQTRVRKLFERMERNAASSAATFAMSPIQRNIKKRTPVGLGEDESGNTRPHLRDVVRGKTRRYKRTIYRVIGYGISSRDRGFHSVFIEGGTKAHETPLTDPSRAAYGIDIKNTAGKNDPGLALPGIFFKLRELFAQGRKLQHPGIAAQQPAAEAFQAKSGQVQARFVKKMQQQLPKETRKLAAKQAKKGSV